ncbi:MAG: protein kinase [Candidatus Aminicenantes bacterium]
MARSQSLTRLTGTGEILGTINYLPPEQITRQEYTPASDIYSLGVVFYELLTLEKPFIGDFPVDIIKQILDKNPVDPFRFRPELTAEINQLIMQMMNKLPEQRPSEELILKTLCSV